MILDGDFTPEEFEKARRFEREGENPNYGPGNPDWERDFEKDRHSEARLQPGRPISTPRQGGRTIDHLT